MPPVGGARTSAQPGSFVRVLFRSTHGRPHDLRWSEQVEEGSAEVGSLRGGANPSTRFWFGWPGLNGQLSSPTETLLSGAGLVDVGIPQGRGNTDTWFRFAWHGVHGQLSSPTEALLPGAAPDYARPKGWWSNWKTRPELRAFCFRNYRANITYGGIRL